HGVCELLRRIRMSMCDLEQTRECLRCDRLLRLLEALADERRELRGIDRSQLDLLRASPERLVLFVEDSLEDVALAREIDVPDLGLRLEDRPHEVREVAVETDDLLELVEDDRNSALPLRRDLSGELEQPLDRLVDVRRTPPGGEAEAQ